MFRNFFPSADAATLRAFPISRGVPVACVEESLGRAAERSVARAIAVGDWLRGTMLATTASDESGDMVRIAPLVLPFARTLSQVASSAPGGESVDDVVIDTHLGRVVLRLVGGTPLFVCALLDGSTAPLESVRYDLRVLTLALSGTAPRVQSAFAR
jgi:hypothetical protein